MSRWLLSTAMVAASAFLLMYQGFPVWLVVAGSLPPFIAGVICPKSKSIKGE